MDAQAHLLLLLASVHFLTVAHLSPPHLSHTLPLFSPARLSHCPILSLPHWSRRGQFLDVATESILELPENEFYSIFIFLHDFVRVDARVMLGENLGFIYDFGTAKSYVCVIHTNVLAT